MKIIVDENVSYGVVSYLRDSDMMLSELWKVAESVVMIPRCLK